MNCSEVTERLPWLMNRSLPETERAEAIRHLQGCESCRRELNETAEFMENAVQHTEPDRIVEYVFGDEMEAAERKAIGDHLQQCAACREEVRLATQSRRAMPFRHGMIRRAVGIAAALLITTGAAAVTVLWRTTLDRAAALEVTARGLEEKVRLLTRPTASARIVDLLPENLRERSGRTGRDERTLSSLGPETTLLLNSQIPLDHSGCVIRLTQGESTLWRSEQTERGVSGEFLVRIPPGFLTRGSYRLHVECGKTQESYVFGVD